MLINNMLKFYFANGLTWLLKSFSYNFVKRRKYNGFLFNHKNFIALFYKKKYSNIIINKLNLCYCTLRM